MQSFQRNLATYLLKFSSSSVSHDPTPFAAALTVNNTEDGLSSCLVLRGSDKAQFMLTKLNPSLHSPAKGALYTSLAYWLALPPGCALLVGWPRPNLQGSMLTSKQHG